MNTRKRFYSYVIPSVLSFVFTGIYCFIDEFFVGNRVGDVGIATINIAFSYIALFGAIGSGIGIGASVAYAITKESESEEMAIGYLGIANWLMLAFSFLVGLPILLFPREILLLLGASEKISRMGIPYMQISAVGSLFMIYASGFAPVVRNLGGSSFVMMANVVGISVNIILDWLLVWVLDWGLAGAAYASVAGMVVGFVLLFFYVVRRRYLFWSRKQIVVGPAVKRILSVGVSPFGLTIAPNVSIIIMNRACLAYGGDPALAAYGVISYLTYIVLLAMQGVGDGSQPLVSEYFGSHSSRNRRLVERLAYQSCLGVAGISMVFTWFTRKQMGIFMGSSEEVGLVIANALPIFMMAFPFSAYARTKASNLYSKERNLQSYVITYLDPVFVLFGTLVFPLLFGEPGVWLSSTFSQVMLAVVAFFLK